MQLINFNVIISIVEECRENPNPSEPFVSSERDNQNLLKELNKLSLSEETNLAKLSLPS